MAVTNNLGVIKFIFENASARFYEVQFDDTTGVGFARLLPEVVNNTTVFGSETFDITKVPITVDTGADLTAWKLMGTRAKMVDNEYNTNKTLLTILNAT